MTTDDACLFCTHPRSAHAGCPHHPACCVTVDCTCIAYAARPESDLYWATPAPLATDVLVDAMPDGTVELEMVTDTEVTALRMSRALAKALHAALGEILEKCE